MDVNAQNQPNPALRIRFLGALEGMMVGDALGGPYEFKYRDSYTPILTHYVRNETFGLQPGCFTDDTSMALCLGESLVNCTHASDNFDPSDIMDRWTRWFKSGHLSALECVCFDIGNQTRVCLTRFAESDRSSASAWQGSEDRAKSGNGGIMRLAPVPVFYYTDGRDKVVEMAALQSRLTHASDLCVDAAKLMAHFMFLAFDAHGADIPSRGVLKRRLFDPSTHVVLGLTADKIIELVQSLPTLASVSRYNISTSGYVIATLHAALWAFARHETFMDGMAELLGMGDDVDTVCAVYGAIAGAWYGLDADGVPATFRRDLDGRCRMLANGVWQPLVDKALGKVKA